MYDKILVPTDGSDSAGHAVDNALELAALCDAELHALYVVETKASYILTVDLKDKDLGEYEAYGETVVTEVVEAAADYDIPDAKGVLKRGKPAEEIVEYAEAEDVDCIVMGRQGHGAIEKYVGSTADRTLVMADVPVTVVR